MGVTRQFNAGRSRRFVLPVVFAGIFLLPSALPAGPGGTREPKAGGAWDKATKACLKRVRPSTAPSCLWMVETRTHVLHSSLSKEYTAAAAVHLQRFDERFRSIFGGEFKDKRKPTAYAFATETEYLKFSPESKGSQGRFLRKQEGNDVVKNLAWFSTPPGETDFHKTDINVVQHEATHQLLDAYTDNRRVPKWFDEGCAAFFESWDLDKKNDENILSGLTGDYGWGISLTFPEQGGPSAFASYWIPHDKLLLLDHVPQSGPVITLRDGREETLESRFASHMRGHQEYSEAWCAMTFLIDHKKEGQAFFKMLVGSFREGADLARIKKKYYSDEFLTSFRTAWHGFIKEKVLPRWALPTVGGGTFPRGLTAAPPEDTRGFGLTKDRRGDMFLVSTEERTIDLDGRQQRVWMLKAWSVPVRFYDETWEDARLILSGQGNRLIGGLYVPVLFVDPSVPDFKAVFLQPAFSRLSKEDRKNLGSRLAEAALGLIFRREKK